jgi:hypothetical protein
VAERDILALLREREVVAQESSDATPVRAARDRRVEPHEARVVDDVHLPPDDGQGVALPHEPAVAEVALLGRVARGGPTVDDAQHRPAAPVRDLQKQGAVSLARVLGREDEEVGGELDLAIRAARGVLQIDDAAIVEVPGLDREVDAAGDLLVGPARAERPAVQDIGPRGDLEASDPCTGRRGRGEKQAEEEHHPDPDTDGSHGDAQYR